MFVDGVGALDMDVHVAFMLLLPLVLKLMMLQMFLLGLLEEISFA